MEHEEIPNLRVRMFCCPAFNQFVSLQGHEKAMLIKTVISEKIFWWKPIRILISEGGLCVRSAEI